mmetsp:Transcript_21829/g.46726  ORF Transcript_21829/g.46726 Transcript_21829/m.46726 type:complete len:261 (-) Transcript_21829:48-830(-)
MPSRCNPRAGSCICDAPARISCPSTPSACTRWTDRCGPWPFHARRVRPLAQRVDVVQFQTDWFPRSTPSRNSCRNSSCTRGWRRTPPSPPTPGTGSRRPCTARRTSPPRRTRPPAPPRPPRRRYDTSRRRRGSCTPGCRRTPRSRRIRRTSRLGPGTIRSFRRPRRLRHPRTSPPRRPRTSPRRRPRPRKGDPPRHWWAGPRRSHRPRAGTERSTCRRRSRRRCTSASPRRRRRRGKRRRSRRAAGPVGSSSSSDRCWLD